MIIVFTKGIWSIARGRPSNIILLLLGIFTISLLIRNSVIELGKSFLTVEVFIESKIC